METNKIYRGDCLEVLKTFPDNSIDCIMTSPPYWALRDYGVFVESIWDTENSNCVFAGTKHKWEMEKIAGDSRITKRSESRAGWERPSREEFASRDVKYICPVCKKEFEGKPNQKFCSIKCLNTLSNLNRTQTKQNSNFCLKCGAWKGQLGLEPTFDLYIKHLADIFDEVKRVLKKDGTCWINLGDTYNNSGWAGDKPNKFDHDPKDKKGGLAGRGGQKGFQDKSLCCIPFRFAIEMQNRGWILRNVIIWHKPNCMPSSVKDRFTVDFEYLFFFTKSKKYWFETQYEPTVEAYSEKRAKRPGSSKMKADYINGRKAGNFTYNKLQSQGRNKRAVWSICPKPFPESHFATYPEELCETPIKAGCPEFVCDKCGEAREKIMKPSEDYKKILECNKKDITNSSEQRSKALEVGNGFQYKTQSCYPDYKFLGYTDCKCNAGFSPGVVLDIFFGAGTTGLVALKQNKKFIGIELNPKYIEIAKRRLKPFLEQQKLI